VDSSGRAIVAGESNGDIAVIRLTTAGALDTSFDTDGKVTVNTGGTDGAYAVAVDSGGRIVVAGTNFVGSSSDFVVVRLNANGSLDTSFSSDGITSATFGANDVGTSLAIDGNGRIVVGGYTDVNAASTGPNDMAVARFLADGTPDTGFSADGKETVDFSSDDRAWAVAVYPNSDPTNGGKVVLAGQWDGGASDFAVVRLDSSGVLDTTFSGNGKFNATFGIGSFGGAEFARAVRIDSAGLLYVGGYTDAGANPDNFGLLRLTATGTLDTTFDGDGKAIYDFNATDDEAYGMVINSNADLAIAGTAVTGSSDFQVIVIEE
jgi:serralysin